MNFVENVLAARESLFHIVDLLLCVLSPAFHHIHCLIRFVCFLAVVALRTSWAHKKQLFNPFWMLAGIQ